MAGLNEEIKVLRERLSVTGAENEQLRTVRDELLAAQGDARDEPPAEPEDAAAYRARIADLQVMPAAGYTLLIDSGLAMRDYQYC